MVVKVSGGRWSYVVASPTMRIPGNVDETVNAYLRMRAAPFTVLQQNAAEGAVIRSFPIPGLCTGVAACHSKGQ